MITDNGLREVLARGFPWSVKRVDVDEFFADVKIIGGVDGNGSEILRWIRQGTTAGIVAQQASHWLQNNLRYVIKENEVKPKN